MEVQAREAWNTRIGVILAVAGSAVGLGNFLRFPGLAAQYGGGAFMIAYFVAFLLVGLPICWAEWTMGRMGGRLGGHSAPTILGAITGKPTFRYLGIIGVAIPVVVYMFYVVIEAWCLAYATNYLFTGLDFSGADGEADPAKASGFFDSLTGKNGDGEALKFDLKHVGFYVVAVFLLNFFLIYRGISKGIEWFCRFAMPLLVVVALIVLVRVLTLGTPDEAHPERNINNGLGYLWNPSKVLLQEQGENGEWTNVQQVFGAEELAAAEERLVLANQTAALEGRQDHYRLHSVSMTKQLANPTMWIAAVGQIFFTLSVGFGVIITYASYLKRDDDVVLSGMAASSANEFCEVSIGGLMIVPAGVAFFGTALMLETGASTFGTGFQVLPMVFTEMPGGRIFGFLFFFLLFLAAVTSSISMLQPGIAFLEDTLKLNRRQSVGVLGLLTAIGTFFVVYFSGALKALDTLDFWVGNLLMVSLALIQVIVFGWLLGLDHSFKAAHEGASVRIPNLFRPVIKYVSPLFLITLLVLWFVKDILGVPYVEGKPNPSGYFRDLFSSDPSGVAWGAVGIIILVGVLCVLALSRYQAPTQPETTNEKELS